MKIWAAAALLTGLAAAARGQTAADAVPGGRAAEESHRLGHSTTLSGGAAQTPDVSPYPVRGIDVSHYEGDILWPRVAAAGTAFAYIKATEGGDYVDDMFAANWSGAAAAGIARGAYHFYNFCRSGADQAAHFVKTVPRERGALPMVVDLERSSDCAAMPARAAFRKDLADFVSAVESAYGVPPVLYVNGEIYDAYFSGDDPGLKLWIADPQHASPQIPGGAAWTFWQYSWHGAVAGISSQTDLDAFSGDAAALAGLAAP